VILQRLDQDSARLFGKGGRVFVAGYREPRGDLAGSRLAEVDDKVSFSDFVGKVLVSCFRRCLNIDGAGRSLWNEAGFGHYVLDELPGALTSIVVAEGDPAAGFENSVAFRHRLAHEPRPVVLRDAACLVNYDFTIVPASIKAKPSLPHEIEFAVLHFRSIRRISKDVVDACCRAVQRSSVSGADEQSRAQRGRLRKAGLQIPDCFSHEPPHINVMFDLRDVVCTLLDASDAVVVVRHHSRGF